VSTPSRSPTSEHDEIFAFVEISDTSFDHDVRVKHPLYASNGIAEYLVVDVMANVLRRYTEPQGDRYRSLTKLTYGDSFSIRRLPGVTLSADVFFNRS
jgi:hypothetical protein